jgi:hypothetical protein
MIMHGEGHVYVGVWMQRDTYIDTEGHVYMVCGSRGTRICRRDMIMIEECTRNGHVN